MNCAVILTVTNTLKAQQSCEIEVTYVDFPDEAQTAFEYAVSIWEGLISSPVTIHVKAKWETLEYGVLSYSDSVKYQYNFEGAPMQNVQYPMPLAEKLYGKSINDDSDADITISVQDNFYSSGYSWYYGTDGNPSENQFDFITIMIHEIAHGLGFQGTMTVNSNNYGKWGTTVLYPAVFDTYFVNSSGQQLVDTTIFQVPSEELYNQYLSALYFNSTFAAEQYNGSYPQMYTASTFRSGSSIMHLDETTFAEGTENSLMTPVINTEEAIHSPGSIALAMLYDMGWKYTCIEHEPFVDTETVTNEFTFTAVITSDTTLADNPVKLYYSYDGFESENSVEMTATGNDNEYSYTLTTDEGEKEISYYIEAKDNLRTVAYTYPGYPPEEYYSFYVGADNVIPEIEHTAIEYAINISTEISLSATVTDNLGVSSVMAEYFINDVEQTSFELTLDEDDEYTGEFPVDASILSENDIIKYRIVATDIATNANVAYSPSEDYHSFTIYSVLDEYSNDFSVSANDFTLYNMSVTTPVGFSDPAIHTTHPYTNSSTSETEPCYAVLNIPIKLYDENAIMTFDEIVLVEPGENGEDWENGENESFYDYVVVEGKLIDEDNWYAFEDGYDSRYDDEWLDLYNSSIVTDNNSSSNAAGKPEYYKTHTINLYTETDIFWGGDEIYIRFRLFPDIYTNGWGWAIDNIQIQGDAQAAISDFPDNSEELQIYPNPANEYFFIQPDEYNSNATLTINNILGKQVYVQKINSLNESNKIDINGLQSGLYIVNLITDEKKYATKLHVAEQ